MWNHAAVTELILLGVTNQAKLKLPLFFLFLLIYVVTLMGNLGMILLTRKDSGLHIPMYFFLGNLAFVDANYSSAITPKMLVDLLVERGTVGFAGCAT